MARPDSLLAALAAATLTLAQPATAAERAGSDLGESEGVREAPGGQLFLFILGFIGVAFLVMAITDDNDPSNDFPTSP